jgi:uncharacterized repeat protein (TIGR01451 family)
MKRFLISLIFLQLLLNSNFSLAKSVLDNEKLPIKERNGRFASIYLKHYIAPAPWQYWSKANEIVITTTSLSTVSGKIYKCGSSIPIIEFTCSVTNPFVYRFNGLPKNLPTHPLNTVIDNAGLYIEASESVSVNLRNVASDDLGTDGTDAFIKGNASLFSFGDAAVGISFRVGYYRDGNIYQTEKPIYSIMAVEDNAVIKIAGITTVTLNKGQSYLFRAPIGTLVESSAAAVMNTSGRFDAPGGCGDGAYNPIPPIASLGNEYVIVRGDGNLIAEQTTVVATVPNTSVIVTFFDANGIKKDEKTYILANAGDFKTFNHGYITGTYNTVNNTGRFSSSHIISTESILVFSGTAGISGGNGCEVDIATLVPISQCSGSKMVETTKFIAYKLSNDLPYFGYIITKSTDKIFITTKNGTTSYTNQDIETIAGIGARVPLGTTGLSLISFSNTAIGLPSVINIFSASRLTVSMVQQSSQFSMSNFISNFPEKSEQPSVEQENCASAVLKASALSEPPYQWYYNGLAISGATQSSYTATSSGVYTITSKLECGISAQSLPLSISICNIDRAITKTVDIVYPKKNTNVIFTLKAENLGEGLATGVSVLDLLPNGYKYVSSNAAPGTNYNELTGIWSIGDLPGKTSVTLTITATVLQVGKLINKAIISGTQIDINTANDVAEAFTEVDSYDREVCVNIAIEGISIPVNNSNNLGVVGLPVGITGKYIAAKSVFEITGQSVIPGTYNYTVTKGTASGFPKTGVIIVKANVSDLKFNTGLITSRCAAAGSNTFTATASQASSITYSLLPLSAGTINANTGEVVWAPSFSGLAKIEALAVGCQAQTISTEVIVNPLPSLTIQNVEMCEGFTSVNLQFSNLLNNPNSFSIVWQGNKLTNVINQDITNTQISIPIDALVGNYPAIITIKNPEECSTEINFNLTIKPRPIAPHVLINSNSIY